MKFKPQKGDIVEIRESQNPINRHTPVRCGVAMVLECVTTFKSLKTYWVKLLWSDRSDITMSHFRSDQFILISRKEDELH